MSNKNVKNSIKALYDELCEMDEASTARLYNLACAAVHPALLCRVIEDCPLSLTESELYSQLTGSVAVAMVVKEMAKARLKGLGVWEVYKNGLRKEQTTEK